DVARDGALADRGGTGEHDEAAAHRERALALLEPVTQLDALAGSEPPDAFRVGDPQLLHDAGDPRRADAGDARERRPNTQGAPRTRGVGPRGLGDVEGVARAAVHRVLDGGACTPRGDGGTTGRDAVDLGHGHPIHPATSRVAASSAAPIPSGPAPRMLRDAVGSTEPRAVPKIAGASASEAPCAPKPGASTGTRASVSSSMPSVASSTVAPTTTPATPPRSAASRTMCWASVSPAGVRRPCTAALSTLEVAASTKTPLPWASARASTVSSEPKPW